MDQQNERQQKAIQHLEYFERLLKATQAHMRIEKQPAEHFDDVLRSIERVKQSVFEGLEEDGLRAALEDILRTSGDTVIALEEKIGNLKKLDEEEKKPSSSRVQGTRPL